MNTLRRSPTFAVAPPESVDCGGTPIISPADTGFGISTVYSGWEYRPEDQISSSFRGILTEAAIGIWQHNPRGSDRFVAEDVKLALEGVPVLTLHLGLYLLQKKNQHLIPRVFREQKTFFFGSIFRNRDGVRCVFCLLRDGRRWKLGYYFLSDTIGEAACVAIVGVPML